MLDQAFLSSHSMDLLLFSPNKLPSIWVKTWVCLHQLVPIGMLIVCPLNQTKMLYTEVKVKYLIDVWFWGLIPIILGLTFTKNQRVLEYQRRGSALQSMTKFSERIRDICPRDICHSEEMLTRIFAPPPQKKSWLGH